MGSFVFAPLVGVKFAGREVTQTMQTGLTSPCGAGAACGRAAGCRYGGTGVMIVLANGAGLPSSGISTSAAASHAAFAAALLRIAFHQTTVQRTEMLRGRGHGLGIEWHHTPPQIFASEVQKLCDADPIRFVCSRRRARRDVRFARVLTALDTAISNKFPVPETKRRESAEHSGGTVAPSFCWRVRVWYCAARQVYGSKFFPSGDGAESIPHGHHSAATRCP